MNKKIFSSLLLLGLLVGCGSNTSSSNKTSSSLAPSSSNVESSSVSTKTPSISTTTPSVPVESTTPTPSSPSTSSNPSTPSNPVSSSTKEESSTFVPSSSSSVIEDKEEVTIYYNNSLNWAEVNCYAWDETGTVSNEWPGTKMSAVEGKDNWYYISFEVESLINVIFNNNSGMQTADIVNVSGEAYFYGLDTAVYSSFEEVEAKLEEAPKTKEVTVYYYNSLNWAEVNLYAWNDNGNLTGEWPGTKMSAVEGRENWYYYTLDVLSAFNVIFNNNSGNQTADITNVFESSYFYGDQVVAYTSFEEVEAIVKPSEPEIPTPEPETKEVTMYYYNSLNWGTVYCYSWIEGESYSEVSNGWPGTAMNAVEGRENWYYVTFEVTAAINVIFNDGSFQQTPDITNIENTSYFYGVQTMAYGSFEEVEEVAKPTEPEPEPETKEVTVYYYNSLNWTTVNCYAWDSNNTPVNGEWPGTAMNPVEGRENWYYVTFNLTAAISVIFNNGTTQTGDISDVFETSYFYGLETAVYTSFEAVEEVAKPSEPEIPTPEPEEGITVYYYNSLNWTTINCYAWDANGNQANGGWPGTAMNAVEGRENWYYVTFEGVASINVIFNNGTKQTADIKDITEDSYFYGLVTTPYANFEAVEELQVPVDPEAPVEGYYFEFTLPNWDPIAEKPTFYYWGTNANVGWPGEAMTLVEGTTNTYCITIEKDVVFSGIIVTFEQGGQSKQSVDIKTNLPTEPGRYELSYTEFTWDNSGKFGGITIVAL